MNENQLQAECFRTTWNYFPFLHRRFWAVPNQVGTRNAVEAMQLQAMGVLPGVYDMHFYLKGRYSIVELKVGRNNLSKPQELYRDAMLAEGAKAYTVWDIAGWKSVVWREILGWDTEGVGSKFVIDGYGYSYEDWCRAKKDDIHRKLE